MRLATCAVLALACLLIVPAAAHAQSTIAGNVSDNTGGVLPGVTVEAASPVLIEGVRTAVTDSSGRYAIVDLRPGTYRITYTLAGFTTVVRDGVVLPGDFTLTLNVVLSVGAIQETVTVSGESPVIDVQRVQRTQVLSRETLQAIPTGNSVWSFAALVPGVKVLRPDVGGSMAMTQALMFGRGASSRQTTVEVDGLNANSFIDDGRFKQYMNPQMTSEQSVTTSGMNAETGHGGLRINIIPREGGNTLSGSFFAGGTPRDWSFDNWNERLGDLGVRGPNDVPGRPSGVPRLARVYDVNAAAGGPILRDRVWFFGSYRDWGTDNVELNAVNRDGTPGIDDNRINSGLLRLTYQATDSNKVSAYLDRISKRRFHQFGANIDRETASATTEPNINYYTANAKWTSTVTSRVLLELGWSGVGEALRTANQPGILQPRPSTVTQCLVTPCFGGDRAQGAFGAPVDPWYSVVRKVDNRLGGYQYGAIGYDTNTYPYNQSVAGSVSYVSGSHNFKTGFTSNWGKYTITENGNGDIVQLNYSSAPNPFGHTVPWIGPDHVNANCVGGPCNLIGAPISVQVRNLPTINRRDVVFDLGVYAQDSWTIDRLTINAGLRVELAKPRNPEVTKPGGRFSSAATFRELDFLPSFGPDLAPRVSLVYDIFGNARTAAKFGWNRYMHAYGITAVIPLSAYAGAAGRSDTREWFDVTLIPGTNTPNGPRGCENVPIGTPGACNNPFGTNGDNVAQDWEIGIPRNDLFPLGSDIRPDPDLQRTFDDVLTVGLQHEVKPGVSVTFEWRRRWTNDALMRSYDARRFDIDANGNFVNNNIWVLEQEFLAPAPYTAIIPIYGIFPSAQRIPGRTDLTIPDSANFLDRFTGFEVSFNARMPGGGLLFGGWSSETAGVGEGAGTERRCGRVVAQGDDPNDLRFCDELSYPRNWRNEFKLSGTHPLPWGLQVAGSYQLYPGWGMFEYFRVERRGLARNHTHYIAPWYSKDNCVAPCVLGQPIVTNNITGQLGDSTTGRTMILLPEDTVKFKPDWTQLDLSVARVFTLGKWRWDVRLEGFNILNTGVEVENFALGSRGTSVGGQNAQFEDAAEVAFGRVLRLSTTARF